MQNIKNKLTIIIYNILIISVILFKATIANADYNSLPEYGSIGGFCDNFALSITNSNICAAMAYLYIPQEFEPEAKKYVNDNLLNQQLRFSYTNKKPNRHGSPEAFIILQKSQKSIQELLLENGAALVYFTDSASNAPSLFAAEAKARKLNLGIWNTTKVLHSTELEENYQNSLNKFVIVEGVLNNIYNSKKSTYLNFGANWEKDFSVLIDNKIFKKYNAFIPEKLKGKRIMVRGWLEDYKGPMIKIFNPANIEIIN